MGSRNSQPSPKKKETINRKFYMPNSLKERYDDRRRDLDNLKGRIRANFNKILLTNFDEMMITLTTVGTAPFIFKSTPGIKDSFNNCSFSRGDRVYLLEHGNFRNTSVMFPENSVKYVKYPTKLHWVYQSYHRLTLFFQKYVKASCISIGWGSFENVLNLFDTLTSDKIHNNYNRGTVFDCSQFLITTLELLKSQINTKIKSYQKNKGWGYSFAWIYNRCSKSYMIKNMSLFRDTEVSSLIRSITVFKEQILGIDRLLNNIGFSLNTVRDEILKSSPDQNIIVREVANITVIRTEIAGLIDTL